MKLKKGYVLQKDGNEYLLVSDGSVDDAGDMLAYSNDTAYYILQMLGDSDGSLTKDDIVDAIFEEYEAPRNAIERDVDELLKKLDDAGLIE